MAASGVPLREAWQTGLYGPAGFYRSSEGPAGHFTTSSHGDLGRLLAHGLVDLCQQIGVTTVVDIGAGRGELLECIGEVTAMLELVGVEVHDPPADLEGRIEWLIAEGGPQIPQALTGLTDVLVVANEWLDVVPCTVAEVDGDGQLLEVYVRPDGVESPDSPLGEKDLDWVQEWWPLALESPRRGERVEVGLARDEAWSDLVGRVDRGMVVVMDYGHTRANRPRRGTLTGYRRGQQVPPVTDGTCDVTAHVAMDSLQHQTLVTQGEALAQLGITTQPPAHDLAHLDPTAYLRQLSQSGAATMLTRHGGLGDFLWAMARKGPH